MAIREDPIYGFEVMADNLLVSQITAAEWSEKQSQTRLGCGKSWNFCDILKDKNTFQRLETYMYNEYDGFFGCATNFIKTNCIWFTM